MEGRSSHSSPSVRGGDPPFPPAAVTKVSTLPRGGYRYYWTQVSGDPDNSVTAWVRVGLWKQVITELYPHPRISSSTESPEPTLWDIILNACCWLKWIYSASGESPHSHGFFISQTNESHNDRKNQIKPLKLEIHLLAKIVNPNQYQILKAGQRLAALQRVTGLRWPPSRFCLSHQSGPRWPQMEDIRCQWITPDSTEQ